ncbi:hypothetical protein HK099_001113, partial [Clydaea vesicula]
TMKKTLNKFKDLRFNQSEKSIRDDSYKPFLATPEWFNKKTIKEENKIEETDVLAILKQKEGKSILFNQMELNYAKKKFFIVLEICATLEKHFVNYIKSNGDELNLSCKVGDIDFNDWKIILETKCRTLLKICEINKEVEFSINCLDLKDSLLLDSLDTISYFDDDSLFILKAEICLKFEKFNGIDKKNQNLLFIL